MLNLTRGCLRHERGPQCQVAKSDAAMPLSIDELTSEPYNQGHLFTSDVPDHHQHSRLKQLNAIDVSLPGMAEPWIYYPYQRPHPSI